MAGERLTIPVFELPLVLLPSERIPLHIFEERYKRMIRHCLAAEEPFGIVLRTDDGAREIGCTAAVEEVLEEFDDGRMNIIVGGESRFRVAERFEGPDFPLAAVTELGDERADEADPGPVLEAFEALLDALDSDAELDPDAELAFEIAARVEIPVEPKQRLLETDAEPARLELLREILVALSDQVQRSRALADRARGNGHGPISGLGPTER